MKALLPLALLAACSKPDNAEGPGGVTVGEARALDEAAQMIDSRALPASDIPTPRPAAPSPGA